MNSHGVSDRPALRTQKDGRRRLVACAFRLPVGGERTRKIAALYVALVTFGAISGALAKPMDRVAQAAGPNPSAGTSGQTPAVNSNARNPQGKTESSSKNSSGTAGKPEVSKPQPAAVQERFDIDEYRVEGSEALPQIDVEEAVYPFLGPNRTAADVENARTALEKAYHSKGYQTVGVSVPQQDAKRGFIVLKVAENRVGRLRVKGSRYFDLNNIKQKAASLEEGKLPKFDEVTKDIVSLNQWPDRRVTPALRAGVTPGTVDVDLNVEDKIPLHGSVELNNRQSPGTTPLRLNASMRYDNLWQLGHSLSVTYQEAPLRRTDATVLSASYLARTDYDWLSILIYGLTSNSQVATVGGANVIGPGQVVGTRGVFTLPTLGGLFHTASFGIDYKHFQQTLALGTDSFDSPVTYAPLVGSYNATWQSDGALTQLNATLTAGLRGIGSPPDEFDAKRYMATANFITLRGDLSHARDLPGGGQVFGKVYGQSADQPLVSSEQMSLGGLDTVRGYLESEVLGDYGVGGTVELRTPNLAPYFEQKLERAQGDPVKFNVFDEWRFFAFGDVGRVRILDPLVDQQSTFDLASYGFGSRARILQYFNAMVLVGVPLVSQQVTSANSPRLGFRLWGEF